MTTKLVFLGTGGGRFVTIDQMRATGGIYVIDVENRLHIDPGPGALIKMHECGIAPSRTGAILVSHCHPDHYIDAEILIEAMTDGCRRKRGVLLASRSILRGIPAHGPAVSRYHQGMVGKCRVAQLGGRVEIDGTGIDVIPAFHSDTSGVGFRIRTGNGDIVWGSDTRLDARLFKAYRGARILILSVTTPLRVRIPFHLNTEDAAKIAEICHPELCIITHFGVRMLKSGVTRQAKWIQEKSGIRTIPARDGMTVSLGKRIEVK
jgi:phosphoribosyl 1,2-cyclic phosphodiesterase